MCELLSSVTPLWLFGKPNNIRCVHAIIRLISFGRLSQREHTRVQCGGEKPREHERQNKLNKTIEPIQISMGCAFFSLVFHCYFNGKVLLVFAKEFNSYERKKTALRVQYGLSM